MLLNVQVDFTLNLKWEKGPDMPITIFGCTSVQVQNMIYVGGRYLEVFRDSEKKYMYTVQAYNAHSHQWHKLPPYAMKYFDMAVIDNQLVLIGGRNEEGDSNLLGVWEADNKRWTYPFPPMPTARSYSSAVGYKKWLVVAGGRSRGQRYSTIEVLNVDTKQWCRVLPAPVPWSSMRSTVVDGT